MTTEKSSNLFSNILVNQPNNWYALITVALPIVYWLYYRKYRNYIYQQKNEIKSRNKPRGILKTNLRFIIKN